MDSLRDEISLIETHYGGGFRDGKLEGELLGLKKGKLEIALELKKAGISNQDICKFTGLSESDIAAL